jgi:UDP:flavonoid glycosyltransferase YjiC (YdhE family)
MRILFCTHPGLSHLFPLVPLAWALRVEGHEILISIADCAAEAAGSGLEIVDVAPDFDMNAINESMMREHPELVAAMATTPVVELEPWAPGVAAVNRPLVPGNMALADSWRPDLVVYDQANTVGLLVADRLGVPAVQQNTILGTGRSQQAIAGHLADLCSRYGVTTPEPVVRVEIYPPSLLSRQPEGPFTRWVPYNGGTVLRSRLDAPPGERPRIAVSMGTIEPEAEGLGPLASIVEAAARVDADFLLAVGDMATRLPVELPPNVRPVGWTPLSSLLRSCTALIHHGGGGTMMNAVVANIPQMIAHDPGHMMHHAVTTAVQQRGIGLVTPADKVDATMIEVLVADDRLRTATREVHDENASLPSPAATARAILDLVA